MQWAFDMANNDIREEIKAAGLKMWEVAYRLGVSDGNFSRRLRVELSETEKNSVRLAIHEIIDEQARQEA